MTNTSKICNILEKYAFLYSIQNIVNWIILYMKRKEEIKLNILKTLACLTAALAVCFSQGYQHTHDRNCGYIPETNSGCAYEVTPIIEGDPPI